eukprot:TRINITY_DN20573_c1_g1_i1.p4 TRINITY_DN20573_c1_g1~~TRINITY_DN20573_c1_g1_i1.p4  ORF type:complete len:115 (-),score=5.80 TRINITY_DN20573_c1_g1_i1:83-427(-)
MFRFGTTAIPTSIGRNLCACMVCCLVKDNHQFVESGCENCPFLEMRGDTDRVTVCTTGAFGGMICVTRPNASWCARWLRLSGCIPGVYALDVQEVSEVVREILESRGLQLRRPE